MNLQHLKIGYCPYSKDLSGPGDRRRFLYFAKTTRMNFEIADPEKYYDIVLLTSHSNLSKWLSYKKKNPSTKFIFEMIDSLIFSSDIFRDLFKGVGRLILGKESKLNFNYKNPVIRWLKIADLVICSSLRLKNIIEEINVNVVISLDYLEGEVRSTKKNFEIGGKMKLAWEGQSVVLDNLLSYKNVFKEINSFCELHIITDPTYGKFGGLIKVPTSKLLAKLPIDIIFHEWKMYNNYEILSNCDCGIIPIDKENKMAWHKPANKLISFWLSGTPTIVSNTPAYTDLMDRSGHPLYAKDSNEWISLIKYIRDLSTEERRSLAEHNLQYALKNYSDAILTKNWENIFLEITEKDGKISMMYP